MQEKEKEEEACLEPLVTISGLLQLNVLLEVVLVILIRVIIVKVDFAADAYVI